MIASLLVSLSLLSADPTAEQLVLLKIFRDEFVAITPGTGPFPKSFSMGRAEGGSDAERPVHEVTFGYSFQIAKYEVPQNLWQAVMGENPSRWKGKRNSVELFSFAEAVDFCDKATALMRAAKLISEQERIRLPSEAEWEYAARAGTKTIYSFGDDLSALNEHAWSTANAAGNDPPVGAKKPNPWNLYDMHGYLWEFCADNWHANYEGAPLDGSSRTKDGDATKVVIRSGSWKDKAAALTSTHRTSVLKTFRDDAVGLRCVLSGNDFGTGSK